MSNAGTITSLTNSGTISGGDGGRLGGVGRVGGAAGVGGAGVSNARGTIASLTNSGTIIGGNGGPSYRTGGAGAGGVERCGFQHDNIPQQTGRERSAAETGRRLELRRRGRRGRGGGVERRHDHDAANNGDDQWRHRRLRHRLRLAWAAPGF